MAGIKPSIKGATSKQRRNHKKRMARGKRGKN